MNRTAQVNSIEAIDQFRAALGVFGDEVGQVLSAIRTDLQRFQNWLEHDQLSYWQHQIRVREERVAEAKNDLHRCLSATIDPHRTPSCLQEKKLLAAAKARLEEAERKLAAVRHWIPAVRQSIVDYYARSEPLASAAAADLPRASAELVRTVERLNAYLQVAPPSADLPAAGVGVTPGVPAATAPGEPIHAKPKPSPEPGEQLPPDEPARDLSQ